MNLQNIPNYALIIGNFLLLLLIGIKFHNRGSNGNSKSVIETGIEKQQRNAQILSQTDNCDLLKYLQNPSQDLKLPYVALASLQGSGNTWTRHLFHVYTGLATGSLYGDPALVNSTEFKMSKPAMHNNLFINNLKNSPYATKLTYKWHEYPHGNRQKFNENRHNDKIKFSKVVLIVRNPFDAVVSQAIRVGTRAYLRNELKMGKQKAEITAKTKRLDFEIIKTMNGLRQENLKRDLNKWLALIVEWLKNEQNKGNSLAFPLCYDLLKNPKTQVPEMQKATEFIGLSKDQYPEHHKGECLMKESEGSFHRKPKTYTALELFGPEAAKLGYDNIEKASKVFAEMGLNDCTKYFKYDKA